MKHHMLMGLKAGARALRNNSRSAKPLATPCDVIICLRNNNDKDLTDDLEDACIWQLLGYEHA